MFQPKNVISVMVAAWILISIFYYNIFNLIGTYKYTDFYKNMHRRLIYTPSHNGTEDFLINTPGCYIPNYSKTLRFTEAKNTRSSCGQRAIFVVKLSNDEIIFKIDELKMKKYRSRKEKIKCCYRFASRSAVPGNEDTDITYSQCTLFQNGTTAKFKEEIITVTCTLYSDKKLVPIYEDAYIILKKKDIKKYVKNSNEKRWNVLLLGMDTMSRARVLNSMPYTVRYLQEHNWLDYKGYQKVGFNTYPNLMSVLTGKKMSTIYKKCTGHMHKCNEIMIWSKFKEAGFVTAYGEEFLRLPDTFSKNKSFKIPPTDHYMRTFFLTGETRTGNLVCTKQLPSAEHLLDYAYHFSNTYKKENFFGMFWLNSYSHNLDNLPSLIDNKIVEFFEKLNETGLLSNTFIVFFSDHGIRYGKMRIPVESYYEERLPMFFIWTPLQFIKMFSEKYYNLKVNQNRLTTPYDLYVTLWEILKLSETSITTQRAEACPKCQSLFEEKSPYRTCDEAQVDPKWCSCHDMNKVESNETDIIRSIPLIISYIQKKTDTIKTTPCMICKTLNFKTVLRSHSYRDSAGNTTYFVIAIVMLPGDVAYEATVRKIGEEFNLIEPINTISEYNKRGNCVKNSNDREYCVCDRIKQCNKMDKS